MPPQRTLELKSLLHHDVLTETWEPIQQLFRSWAKGDERKIALMYLHDQILGANDRFKTILAHPSLQPWIAIEHDNALCIQQPEGTALIDDLLPHCRTRIRQHGESLYAFSKSNVYQHEFDKLFALQLDEWAHINPPFPHTAAPHILKVSSMTENFHDFVVTPEHGLFLLDDRMDLWQHTGTRWECVDMRDTPPTHREHGEIALAWDAPNRRLVACGGGIQETMIIDLEEADWIFFSETGPARAETSTASGMLSTPHGVFCLQDGKLWHLRQARWEHISTLDFAHNAAGHVKEWLFYDPASDLLFASVLYTESHTSKTPPTYPFYVFDGQQWQSLPLKLPTSIQAMLPYKVSGQHTHPLHMTYDPYSRQWILMTSAFMYMLPLMWFSLPTSTLAQHQEEATADA